MKGLKKTGKNKENSKRKRMSTKNQTLFHFWKEDSSKKKIKYKKCNKIVQNNQTIVYQGDLAYPVKYLHPKIKKKQPLKVGDPELYQQHILRKREIEIQLAQIYDKYGKQLPKQYEPPTKPNFLLNHMTLKAEELLEDLEFRKKSCRKMVKQNSNVFQKVDEYNKQMQKQKQKNIKKEAQKLAKMVQRQWWGSVRKVKRYITDCNIQKQRRQIKGRKLQHLVQKQLLMSKTIGNLLKPIESQEPSDGDIILQLNLQGPSIQNVKIIPKQPFLLKHQLRQYQRIGMHWIITLHNKKLNGILADQMGLGKTIQTIAVLAELAANKGIWGPHLIVVPSTIMINWEIQFKRWCPGFKILTYFGSPKQRKQKRKGWSKANFFHICITSYKIAVVDQTIFKRKKWYFMVLDEAHHLKNYNSQRWQILLNFNTKNRLLLTGTPLQNDVGQLWSLLHFLMPKIFQSQQDFHQWFSLPMKQALQKNFQISKEIIHKLHSILRPFMLRRLKKDVQKQLPKKQQFIVRCPLSRRQRLLYDQFLHLDTTANTIQNRDLLAMMNLLMQLKKVCNHPDLFSKRGQQTPIQLPVLNQIILTHLLVRKQIPIILNKRGSSRSQKTQSLQILTTNLKQQFQLKKQSIPNIGHKWIDINYNLSLQQLTTNYEQNQRKHNTYVYEQYIVFLLEGIYKQPKGIFTVQERINQVQEFKQFIFAIPKVQGKPQEPVYFPFCSDSASQFNNFNHYCPMFNPILDTLHPIKTLLEISMPSKSCLQTDSGKLNTLIQLLLQIKKQGGKVLLFTQMSKMIDILQKVLNFNRLTYVRLDGSTKVDIRQQIVERFNNDNKIFAFLSSTRAGGVGINLTAANAVVFYDTDWNPAMDKQAQDRCHRIGQTRSVKIYRLITQSTIEQNILLKSIQKKKLEQIVTQEGGFSTSGLNSGVKDILQGYFGKIGNINIGLVEDEEDRIQQQGQNMKLNTDQMPGLFRNSLQMVDQQIQKLQTAQPFSQLSQKQQQQQSIQQQQQEQEDKQNNQLIQQQHKKAIQLYKKNAQFIKKHFF